MLIIVAAGIITIYSIYYVSMGDRVQEYGKIKAIGATKGQLKRIVLLEGFPVAGVAAPLGLAAASLVPAFLQEVMYVNENNVPEKDIHDLSHKWLALRTADIECVLDSVEEAKQNGAVNDAWFIESETEKSAIESVLAMADVEKIGLMGHSLGGAAHMNFTDLPLFAPPLASALGTGTVDATACIETMNAMVLEYMNCYLAGSGE